MKTPVPGFRRDDEQKRRFEMPLHGANGSHRVRTVAFTRACRYDTRGPGLPALCIRKTWIG
jgi:hypothetical protein